MQIQYIGYRVKGLYRVAKLSSLATGMSQEVEARLKILRHWERYGLSSAIDAFGKSRSTLYSWRKQLRSAGGNTASLKPASRSPHRKRKPQWDPRLVKEIKRLRTVQANLGKDKLYAMLLPFCKPLGINPPSTSTIGRIIARTPDKMRTAPVRLTTKGKRKTIHRTPVSRKPKNLKLSACECLAYDTIVRQRDGVKRHILTAIDPIVHLAFAYAPPSAASQHAASLHQAISTTFEDFKDAKALTDNGSEFKGKFSKSLQQKGIQHWHTYPKSPKMNAHCERFNRSIQESFVDYHEDLLFTDLNLFNQKMSEWIVFYNTQLPHLATKPFPKKSASKNNLPITPLQCLLFLQPQSSMYWTHTTKIAIDKLDADLSVLRQTAKDSGFFELAVRGEHTEVLVNLPLLHRDPFDRMLVAQTMVEPMKLITADAVLGKYTDLVMMI